MIRRDRGMVLLLVLVAVSLLAMLAVDLASRASADSLRRTRTGREAAFRRLFDSGAEVGRGLLQERAPEVWDAWGQSWHQTVRFDLGDQKTAVLTMIDESGKLNIARAVSHPEEAAGIDERLDRLFDYLSRHDPQRKGGWKEIGEKIRNRLAARRVLLTLDALRETGLDTETVFGSEGVSRYLTCMGSGTINLNTAPAAVLYAIDPELDDAMVDRITGFRGKGEADAGPRKAFQDPKDLMLVEGIVNRSVGANGELKVDRNLYEKIKGAISVQSACFSGRIAASVDGRPRLAWCFFTPSGVPLALEEILP